MDLRVRTENTPAAAGPTRPATASAAVPAGKEAPDTGRKSPPPAPAAAAVQQAVVQIQGYLRDSQRELDFQVDETSGRTVIRVVNPASGELVRQIPAEEVLKVAAAIEAGRLRLMDQQA